jgi:Major intrinsic protein
VSLAFAVTRHFPWSRVVAYWLAQATRAIIAAAVLRASLGNVAHGAALGAVAYQLVRGESLPADVRSVQAEREAA